MFDAEFYRAHNLDLRDLDSPALAAHFAAHQDERRLFAPTKTTVEALSMRWLRGAGIEIGAGGSPTPLFGNATTMMGDVDDKLAFGGERLDLQGSIDSEAFGASCRAHFDFAIASHVLEHADSFLRALLNLIQITRPGGIVYVVLPDIRFIGDVRWMPFFDFGHHVREFNEPLAYAQQHDDLYREGCGDGIFHSNEIAHLTADYQQAVAEARIPAHLRFLHHKHNYNFDGWLKMMTQAQQFFGNAFEFADVRFGHERQDCHFVLQVQP